MVGKCSILAICVAAYFVVWVRCHNVKANKSVPYRKYTETATANAASLLSHRMKKSIAKEEQKQTELQKSTADLINEQALIWRERRVSIWQKRWNITMEQKADIDSHFPSFEYSNRRAECLQSNLVLQQHGGGTWKRESIHGEQFAKDGDWVFQPTDCPLVPFSDRYMCQVALGCESVLIVGDSTTNTIFHDGQSLFGVNLEVNGSVNSWSSHKVGYCSTSNGCDVPGSNCRPTLSSVRPVLVHHQMICKAHCSKPVKLSYVRHNHLVNHHGQTFGTDLQCDEWKTLQNQYKYVWASTGPHIPGLIEFPHGVFNNVSAYMSLTSTNTDAAAYFMKDFVTLFEQEANDLVDTFLSGGRTVDSKTAPVPDRVLIYQTGQWGMINYSEDCKLKPHDTLPARPEMVRGRDQLDRYYWELIPLLNEAYVRVLKQRLNSSQLLLLDVADMHSMRYSCRTNYIHFHSSAVGSPAARVWQLLYNSLLLRTERPKD